MQSPDHRIERIGDADDKGVRRIFLDAGADRFHDLEVDAEQIVAAHPRLARHPGRHDDNVGPGDGFIAIRPRERRIETVDRTRLGKIQRLALRCPFRDVEEDDVAKLFERREVSQGSADLTGSDQCDLAARHVDCPLFLSRYTAKRRTLRVENDDVCRKLELYATLPRPPSRDGVSKK